MMIKKLLIEALKIAIITGILWALIKLIHWNHILGFTVIAILGFFIIVISILLHYGRYIQNNKQNNNKIIKQEISMENNLTTESTEQQVPAELIMIKEGPKKGDIIYNSDGSFYKVGNITGQRVYSPFNNSINSYLIWIPLAPIIFIIKGLSILLDKNLIVEDVMEQIVYKPYNRCRTGKRCLGIWEIGGNRYIKSCPKEEELGEYREGGTWCIIYSFIVIVAHIIAIIII